MALTAKQRKALPPTDFAGPGHTYPDDTKVRARNALSRASQNASPAVQSEVKSKVARKYPSIKVTGVTKRQARTGSK